MKVGATTPTHQCGEAHTIKLASFVADKVFDDLKDDLIKRAYTKLQPPPTGEGWVGIFDAQLFNYTAKTLTNGFIQGWRNQPVKLVDLGFEYGFDDPNILTAYEMNLFRFAGVKTLYEAQRLNELFRATKSFKEFYDTASSMLTVHNRDWLETEFNTAIATGESAATYARLMKQTELFPYWEYKTVGDNKVRHSHQLLDGIILPWNSPLWQYLMPPNDWNCRCYIVPRTKAEVSETKLKESLLTAQNHLNSAAFKKAAKAGWGINRADKGMVFTENQHYTNDYLDAIGKLDKINYKQYGLKPINEITSNEDLKPNYKPSDKDKAIADFFDGLEKVSAKKSVINDFNNRNILIAKSTVKSHTNTNIDKYKERHRYLEFISQVLKTPDEVWLHSYNSPLNNYIYIKHYKGQSLAVITRLKDNLNIEIETWYLIVNDVLRSGLLLKN